MQIDWTLLVLQLVLALVHAWRSPTGKSLLPLGRNQRNEIIRWHTKVMQLGNCEDVSHQRKNQLVVGLFEKMCATEKLSKLFNRGRTKKSVEQLTFLLPPLTFKLNIFGTLKCSILTWMVATKRCRKQIIKRANKQFSLTFGRHGRLAPGRNVVGTWWWQVQQQNDEFNVKSTYL